MVTDIVWVFAMGDKLLGACQATLHLDGKMQAMKERWSRVAGILPEKGGETVPQRNMELPHYREREDREDRGEKRVLVRVGNGWGRD